MLQMLKELTILTKYRNFLELCFAVLVSMIGFGLILPLLPIYGREMGASGVYLGLLTSLFGITRSITSLPGGVLADRVGRKKLIVGGLVTYTAVMFLFGVSTNLYHLLILRACQGAASGVVWPVAATMVADIVEPKDRGKYFICGNAALNRELAKTFYMYYIYYEYENHQRLRRYHSCRAIRCA